MRSALMLAALFLIGCESSNVASSTSDSKPNTSVSKDGNRSGSPTTKLKPKVNNRPEVAADAFDSVADAISALTLATDAQFDDERYKATEWLVMQKDVAVPPLSEAVSENSSSSRTQIVIARILGRIGTPAAAGELVKMTTAENSMGAINAIQQLGAMKPAGAEAIDQLVSLLDHQEERRRLEAVNALGNIGQPAAAASKRLVAIQNSQDSDSLRQAARRALEKVDPRKTLAD